MKVGDDGHMSDDKDGYRGISPWRLAAAASEAERLVPGCRLVPALVPEIQELCMCIFLGEIYRGYLVLATGEVVLDDTRGKIKAIVARDAALLQRLSGDSE